MIQRRRWPYRPRAPIRPPHLTPPPPCNLSRPQRHSDDECSGAERARAVGPSASQPARVGRRRQPLRTRRGASSLGARARRGEACAPEPAPLACWAAAGAPAAPSRAHAPRPGPTLLPRCPPTASPPLSGRRRYPPPRRRRRGRPAGRVVRRCRMSSGAGASMVRSHRAGCDRRTPSAPTPASHAAASTQAPEVSGAALAPRERTTIRPPARRADTPAPERFHATVR
jgi:hypothetical protein